MITNIPEYDIEQQVRAFMDHLAVTPAPYEHIIIDGDLHRYDIDGEKRGKKSGAYLIHSDGLPAGFVQDWRQGIKANWKFDTQSLHQEQRDYFSSEQYKAKEKAEREKRELERKIKQVQAAELSRTLWDNLRDAPEDHFYLKSKQVYPYGIRINSENKLAVPLRDINGIVKSIQWINTDGSKRFQQDTALDGLFWCIGLDTINPVVFDGVILLGEGFATMAKLYELTGKTCVAGLSCYSLKAIAQAIKGKYSKCKIIIMADNDWTTEAKRGFNPGIAHAQELVKEGLAVDVIAPTFDHNEDGSDWDDFALLHGDDYSSLVISDRINEALIPPHIKAIRDKITIVNAQELRKKVFAPIKWAVDGFLPEGLSILAGGPKVGKSILALHLSVGVAIGGCVLGKIFVQQGDVLYLALEDTQRRLQERINGGEIAGEENIDLSHLEIVTEIPRQNLGGSLYIEYWISTHPNARLVIIDTLQMFRKLLTGKGSMYSEDYEAISAIKKIADTYGVAILILHHLKKGMEGDWLSEISGSQGIAGAADTIFSLKRERNSTLATLHRTGRDVEEKDFIMKLDGFGWTLQDDAEAFTMPEWKRQILDYLKGHDSVTPMQLAETYNLNANTAKSSLIRLAKEGSIKKIGYGTYGLAEN